MVIRLVQNDITVNPTGIKPSVQWDEYPVSIDVLHLLLMRIKVGT